MRRFFITSVLLLLVSILYASPDKAGKRKLFRKVVFPVVETPAVHPRVKSLDDQIREIPIFQDLENKRYQDTLFAVEEISDIQYANLGHVGSRWRVLFRQTMSDLK